MYFLVFHGEKENLLKIASWVRKSTFMCGSYESVFDVGSKPKHDFVAYADQYNSFHCLAYRLIDDGDSIKDICEDWEEWGKWSRDCTLCASSFAGDNNKLRIRCCGKGVIEHLLPEIVLHSSLVTGAEILPIDLQMEVEDYEYLLDAELEKLGLVEY